MANEVEVIYTDAEDEIENSFCYICGCKRKYKGNKEVSESFPSKIVVCDNMLKSTHEKWRGNRSKGPYFNKARSQSAQLLLYLLKKARTVNR